MPVYNCEETLEMAINSIIWQTYAAWELLIIDDGSTDNTVNIAKAYYDPRIRLLADGKNRKLAARLNQAIKISRGKYFARMDADDIAFPDRILRQVTFLEKNNEVDLVGSRVLIFDRKGAIVGTYPFRENHAAICKRPSSGFYLPHPTWMGKRSWFLKHCYKESMPKTQDQELLLRTYHVSKFACLPDFLHGYRVEDLSLKKILMGRVLFISALLRMGSERKLWPFYLGVFEQLTKLLVDVFAIVSGLKYRIVSHRAKPVDEQVCKQWQHIWKKSHQN
jgi:glycosyltransferase involved in cell wall biosynthesis